MQQALVRYFDSAFMAVPNVDFSHEIDLAVVTRSNYLYDVEIKCSHGDWDRDYKKRKWENVFDNHFHWERIRKFYWAVLPGMEQRIPDWVPEYTGILIVNSDQWGTVKEFRKATVMKARKLTHEEISDLGRVLYFRYWSLRKTWPAISDLDDGSTYMQKPEFMVSQTEEEK